MRRTVVIIMIVLLILMLMSDLSVLKIFYSNSFKIEKIIEHSYFHYLVLSKFAFPILYLRLMFTITVTFFWILQLWKAVNPTLLRRCTSYYVGLYLLYIYIIISGIPMVLATVGQNKLSVAQLLSITFNSIGYAYMINLFGTILITTFLLLILPIVHEKLAHRPS